MKRFVPIVEGYGDVEAVPVLIGRTGAAFGLQIISEQPIRAGEWKSLRAPGKLERYLELAASRNADAILIFLDLDDGCAVAERDEALERIESWRNGRPIEVGTVFAVREYECMFLHVAELLNPEAAQVANSDQIRDAKGGVRAILGRRYKETQDQISLTRTMPLAAVFERCRFYRKFCKELTGLNYNEMPAIVV